MANRILLKRSSSQNGIPLTTDLSLGELALNTYDGRLFTKKDDGTAAIVDLTKNQPIRVLGDASSTYAWHQGDYTSNVTVTLNTVNSDVGSYGGKAAGVLTVPIVTVNAKGLVTGVTTTTFSAANDLGTMAVQNADNVNITGGNINGVVIGATSAKDATFANVTVNGTLYSNDITATSIDIDGDAVITGNLTVQGTTTTVNSTTVEVGDKNIVLAKDAANSAAADGAGLTINGAGATITYNHTGTRWEFNKPVYGSSTATFAGQLNADGGISVDTGAFTVANTTGDIHTGGNLDVDQNTTLNGTLTVDGLSTLNGGITSDSGVFTVADTTGDIHTSGNLDVDGTIEVSGLATLNGGITSDSGVFTVADTTGDIHTSGNLDVDQNTTLNGTLTVDGLTNLNGGIAVDTNKFTVADSTGDTYIDGNLDVKGDLTNDNVSANGVVFGASVTGELTTSANLTFNSATDTLTIKNVDITGTATFSGGFNLGAGVNEIIYGNSVDGSLESEAAFTYNATTNTLGVDNVGVVGNIAVNTNKFIVTGSSGDTTVGGTLGVDGNTTLTGNLAVNGGNLTTNQTTFNLVNATATTVNFAGAATTVAIGAAGSAGTLTVKNDNVVLDGDLQIKGGDLTTNQTTFNLLNSTATTINFGGAGTTVNIGASSGTTWIKNNANVAGTFGVQGGVTFDNTLDVAGAASFANVVSLTNNLAYTLGNYNTGTLRVTGDVSVNGKIQAFGAIYKAGYEVLNTQDTIDGGTY